MNIYDGTSCWSSLPTAKWLHARLTFDVAGASAAATLSLNGLTPCHMDLTHATALPPAYTSSLLVGVALNDSSGGRAAIDVDDVLFRAE